MKKLLTIVLAVASLLPTMAQEVEVTSLQRLLEGVEGPAYYPVLDQSGKRLLFTTQDGALKYHDLTDNVTTVVTRDYVAGHDACWGGDGKVYFVTQHTGDDRLVYRTGLCYDTGTRLTTVVTEAQHGSMRAVPGIPAMDRAMIVLTTPGPSAVEMTMDKRMPGMAWMISRIRMTMLSAVWPKKPAMAPSTRPSAVPITVATTPIKME